MGSGGQLTNVLQVRFERRTVRHCKNSVVSLLLLALTLLLNFEDAYGSASQDNTWISLRVMDYQDVERVAVFQPWSRE